MSKVAVNDRVIVTTSRCHDAPGAWTRWRDIHSEVVLVILGDTTGGMEDVKEYAFCQTEVISYVFCQ